MPTMNEAAINSLLAGIDITALDSQFHTLGDGGSINVENDNAMPQDPTARLYVDNAAAASLTGAAPLGAIALLNGASLDLSGTHSTHVYTDATGDQVTDQMTGGVLSVDTTGNLSFNGVGSTDVEHISDTGGNSFANLSGTGSWFTESATAAGSDNVTLTGAHETAALQDSGFDFLQVNGTNDNAAFENGIGRVLGTHDFVAMVSGRLMDGTGGNTLFGSGGSGTLTDVSSGVDEHITTGTGTYNITAGSGLTGDVINAGQATDTINLQAVAGQTIAVHGDAAQTSTLTSADVSTDVASIKYNATNGVDTIAMTDGQVIKATNFTGITFADGVTTSLQAPAASSNVADAAAHEHEAATMAIHVAAIHAAHMA